MIDLAGMTFGYELELGDVSRTAVVPSWAGTWEYAECDIVNIHGQYAGVACDPLGKEPPVGGEINMLPSRSVVELSGRIGSLIRWFQNFGDQPSASCVNHGHVHVRVPGLRDDIEALKRLTAYIMRHQESVIKVCYDYKETPEMAECKTARTYLKWDGGRPMPGWMGTNIIEMAENFDDFIRIQCCGKDGVSRGRPFRYAINTYCLKHTDTVEFRCFRASIDEEEIFNSILFAQNFMQKALDGSEPEAPPIFPSKLPRLVFNKEHYLGWERTKWDKSRGKKERRYVAV